MTAIDKIIDNPLLRELHARQRAELMARFTALSFCSHRHILSLEKYLNAVPQQFYMESVYLEYLEWLNERDRKNRKQLQTYLSEHAAEIDRALLHLEEVNGLGWHDSFEKLDDYEVIRFIDQQIHPSYLRLVEAVFCPLMRLIAHFSRIDRGCATERLDVWNIVQELHGLRFDEAIRPYRHTIRNGIGHGGVTYLQKAIRYKDSKDNEEEFGDSDVVRICDDMLDVCNAIALAISVFLIARQQEDYLLPRQLLIEELRAETRSPWWEIVGCTPSRFSGVNQLIIYARPHTSDYQKVQFASFQSGVLAEQFAPGYDRYFFSLRAEHSWPGWAAFNGKKLRILRECKCSSLEDYGDVLEDNLVFYVPRFRLPRLLGRFETLIAALKINIRLAAVDHQKKFGMAEVYARNVEIHRNSWGAVVNGSVYIVASTGKVDQNTIRKSCRRIIQKAVSTARCQVSRTNIARYLPLGFARIAVFQKNYRKRRLSNYGLEKNLICTIQVQRLHRIQSRDIGGSTIEKHGKYRIAWNRVWLDSSADQGSLQATAEDDAAAS